jgi:predicted nucleic acid-binding protein
MALTHLVDTSVLTRVAQPAVRSALEPLMLDCAAARAGMSDLEIGFSARNGAVWDRLAEAISSFPLVETTERHVRRARQVQRLLAERGLKGRKIPDLLVAAAAEDRGLVVLHYDSDFDHISRATGQASAWVVPAGKID